MKKQIRQPWFLILVMVASLYTYQFYNSGKSLKISTSTALATSDLPKEQQQKPVQVDITQEFPAARSHNFVLSTFLNTTVKFIPSDQEKIKVSLTGKGVGYKNDGQRLADWFIVSSAGKTLKIESPESKNKHNNVPLNQLGKLFKKEVGADFVMTVEFPKSFEFNHITIFGVRSDVFGETLVFDELSLTTVSGDLRLKQSKGRALKMESVSGDSHLQMQGLKEVEISSVSGDAIMYLDTNPQMKFASVSGDLNLRLPSDSQVDVDFESMTGDLVNDFNLSKKATHKLKFSSLSGSAKIHKVQ